MFDQNVSQMFDQRQTLFDEIRTVDEYIINKSEDNIVNVLLFGKPNNDSANNKALSLKYKISTI